MKNIELLLSTVNEINHISINGSTISIKTKSLSGKEIYKILETIKWANNRFPRNRFTIAIKSNRFASSDVVSVLEIIMLFLSINYPRLWKIDFKDQRLIKNNILYNNSLLAKYNNELLGASFAKDFNSKVLRLEHYRAIISLNDFLEDNKSVSAYCDDIFSYLKHTGISETLYCDLFEACSEVINNVFDHTETDCLVDIKCSTVVTGQKYFSINIISLSDVFIGTKLIELLKNNKINEYSGANIVLKAFDFHSKYFSQEYDLESFGFVCSFQNRVSTRGNSTQSGGTGLTTLIKKIHGKKTQEEYYSYIISGKNMLNLKTDYLTVDSNGLIGVNDNNDFYSTIPSKEIIMKEERVFPGTIFSISLLL